MRKGKKSLSWILRILLILVSLFFMLFSLDVFSEGYTFWNTILAFLIHNKFTILFLIILFIAWKKEHMGGGLLVLVGIYMIFYFGGPLDIKYGTWIMIGMPVLVGILFLCNYYLFKSNQ